MLTLAAAAAVELRYTLTFFYIYFVIDKAFPQFRHVALTIFAFPITDIAASVVCIEFCVSTLEGVI